MIYVTRMKTLKKDEMLKKDQVRSLSVMDGNLVIEIDLHLL